MAVLTESSLRSQQYRDKLQESVLKLPKGTILTPSAKSFLQEKKVTVEFVELSSEEPNEEETSVNDESSVSDLYNHDSFKYRLMHGGFIDEKPEYMTSLHSDLLVFKDHLRIVLRGKLDSLEAKMIEGQMKLVKYPALIDDLSELIGFVRQILRSEVMEEELGKIHLLNMNEHDIREMSHQPEKYFGEGYFTPDYRMGEGIVVLNSIRTFVRETELSAYQAFKKEDGSTERDDIILALNRLSSICLIMMFKYKTGDYNKVKEG